MTVVYRKRENLFENGECEWRVEDDALVRTAPGGAQTRLNWADVRSLRVRFSPSTAKPWLHQFSIETASGSATIDNCQFAGIAQFEDRSADYAPFVRAALERIAVLAPGAQVHVGSTPFAFWGSLAFMTACFALLIFVLIAIPLPAPLPVTIAVKLGVIVYGLFLLPRWIRRNWPRGGDLQSAARELPV